MKPLKRTVSLLLLLLLVCLPLSACGESGGTTTKDVPVAELADTVIAAVGKTDSLAESDIMFLGLTLNRENRISFQNSAENQIAKTFDRLRIGQIIFRFIRIGNLQIVIRSMLEETE